MIARDHKMLVATTATQAAEGLGFGGSGRRCAHVRLSTGPPREKESDGGV